MGLVVGATFNLAQPGGPEAVLSQALTTMDSVKLINSPASIALGSLLRVRKQREKR